MKRFNTYFPIWVLAILPPLLFLTLTFNAVMAVFALIIVLLIIDRKNIFEVFTKNILKLWGVTLLVDLVTFILMVIPEFFINNSFIKENLAKPLEDNPYSNVYAAIYMIIIVILNIIIIYNFVNRIVIKKYDLNKSLRNLSKFILIIFLIPYMFLIPSNKIIKRDYLTLNDYRGITIQNKNKVIDLLKYIEKSDSISSYVIDIHAKPYILNLYMNDMEDNHQVIFEKNAAILFNLIDDIDEVNFYLDGKKYNYTTNSLNAIFKNIRKKEISDVYDRYKDERFENYNYLGHITDYDVFDVSEFCELEHQLLFTTQDTEYYMSCTAMEQILLYKGKESIDIKKALDQGIITSKNILDSTIDLIIKEVQENEDNS